MIKEITLKDWSDLQNILFDIKNKKLDRYRSEYLYRGVSNKEFGLETSIQRIGNKPSDIELHLIRSFKKYSPINTLVDNYNNIWNWLSLAQHYGLPTRLLDWTYSPNIALHFLTEKLSVYNIDGAIWRVNYSKLKNQYPKKIERFLDEKSIIALGTDDLSKLIGKSYDDFMKFSKKNENAILFFEPPSIDDRIVNQFAMFSTMLDPDSNKKNFLENTGLIDKIIIPKEMKWEIRDKLDQSNISERIIYPGLDGIAKWISRWYSNRDENMSWKLE